MKSLESCSNDRLWACVVFHR